jgi:hypothetical protein
MLAASVLHAKEASMSLTRDVYHAVLGANQPDEQFTAFNVDPGGPPGTALRYRFGALAYGRFGGVVGNGGTVHFTRILNLYTDSVGVHGTARDFGGVAGTSLNRVGVYGQVEGGDPLPFGVRAGVIGAATTQAGVFGFSENGLGVLGSSYPEVGVRGGSALGKGVRGSSLMDAGVLGVSGNFEGPPLGMNLPTIAGVVGSSDDRPGVIGTSNALIGVYGFSAANAGVVGESTNSFAGYFAGNVMVTGDLFVAGAFNKKGCAVPFPDGTHRALYCMESPDLWFEDFGAAKLRRGRATVKLDADFAKVIKRGDYHVFLTPRGDCRGLYVRSQSGASFEVRELAGGTSSVAFSYRIVGRRKDITRHKRFAKIDTRLALPAVRARRRPPTRRAFLAELEREARARATPAMRKSDREFAAKPPANVQA